jgi:hypothetical protein
MFVNNTKGVCRTIGVQQQTVGSLVSAQVGNPYRIQMNVAVDLQGFCRLAEDARQMSASAFTELRLLSSGELDSSSILPTVLAGDNRLAGRLQEADLLSIASRIRARLRTETLEPCRLLQCLNHLLKMTDNPKAHGQEIRRLAREFESSGPRQMSFVKAMV